MTFHDDPDMNTQEVSRIFWMTRQKKDSLGRGRTFIGAYFISTKATFKMMAVCSKWKFKEKFVFLKFLGLVMKYSPNRIIVHKNNVDKKKSYEIERIAEEGLDGMEAVKRIRKEVLSEEIKDEIITSYKFLYPYFKAGLKIDFKVEKDMKLSQEDYN